MATSTRLRNAVRGLLQSYAPAAVKSRLWNAEFAHGKWACLDSTPDDCIYGFLEKYANRGSILDLGCGSGSTGNEMAAESYAHYTGVDISDVALGMAQTRSEENGRSGKNRFYQSDLAGYAPEQKFNIILYRDSIYYLPQADIQPALERFSRFLTPSGVFIVRLWDGREKHRNIVQMIESNFHVVEQFAPAESKTVVVVFRL
jgi:SAM-dependent methyltransferase